MSLLNCHAQIHCERELFLDFLRLKYGKVLFPYLFIRGNMPRSGKVVGGFVLRLDQLEKVLPRCHPGPARFLDILAADGWKIVHLKREDHLRQAVSNVTGIVRGQVHDSVVNPLRKTRVRMDPQALVRTINWMKNTSRKEEKLIENREHMTVVYERDLLDSGDHQATSDRIFEYLGLESQPVTPGYRRISSGDLLEDIDNGAEIKEAIRNAGYAAYL